MKTINKIINQTNFFIIATIVMALTACTKSTENDSSTPATIIAPSTLNNKVPSALDSKIDQLQREAQEGDPDAQYDLAYRYEQGLDVPKDPAKALELYKSAADQGHSAAQTSLDNMNKTAK